MDMIINKLRTELIRLNSELSDSLDRYKEQDQMSDDELIAQGWFEATEHFSKILEQYIQEESEENNEIENLKQKLQRLSTIITDLWDIFPKETQEELNILLESEEQND